MTGRAMSARLRHAAERAVIMADGDATSVEDFPLAAAARQPASLSVVGDSLNLDRPRSR